MSAEQPESIPKLLTAEEVASAFDVRPLTLRRWVSKGTFPKPIQPNGPGGRRYWPEEAVATYIRGRGPAS